MDQGCETLVKSLQIENQNAFNTQKPLRPSGWGNSAAKIDEWFSLVILHVVEIMSTWFWFQDPFVPPSVYEIHLHCGIVCAFADYSSSL